MNGRPCRCLRWEGHDFYRLLPGNLKQKGMEARLAHPSAGTISYLEPAGALRFARPRPQIDLYEAALSSCARETGQVMGSHWKNLGFSSAEHMVKVACSGRARPGRADGAVHQEERSVPAP